MALRDSFENSSNRLTSLRSDLFLSYCSRFTYPLAMISFYFFEDVLRHKTLERLLKTVDLLPWCNLSTELGPGFPGASWGKSAPIEPSMRIGRLSPHLFDLQCPPWPQFSRFYVGDNNIVLVLQIVILSWCCRKNRCSVLCIQQENKWQLSLLNSLQCLVKSTTPSKCSINGYGDG